MSHTQKASLPSSVLNGTEPSNGITVQISIKYADAPNKQSFPLDGPMSSGFGRAWNRLSIQFRSIDCTCVSGIFKTHGRHQTANASHDRILENMENRLEFADSAFNKRMRIVANLHPIKFVHGLVYISFVIPRARRQK